MTGESIAEEVPVIGTGELWKIKLINGNDDDK